MGKLGGVARPTLRTLAWRHLGSGWASTGALVLAIGAALVLPCLPLMIHAAAPSRPSAQALATSGAVVVTRSGIPDANAYDSFQREVQTEVHASSGGALDDGTEFADAGSLQVMSVNGQAPVMATQLMRASYVSDLDARVQVVAGELATSVANGVQGTVSMAQDGAARLKLFLGDVICLDRLPSGPPWCARLVGLWRRLVPGDAYWRGRSALALYTDRVDFFGLVAPLRGAGAEGGRWYLPDPGAVTAANADEVSHRLQLLGAAMGSDGTETFRNDLGASLRHYAAAGRLVAFDERLQSAALFVQAVLLVAVMAGGFLGARREDLAALRAWGWSTARILGLLLIELGAAMAGGLAVAALTAAAVVVGWRPDVLGADRGALVAPVAIVGGVAACLAWLGALAARHGKDDVRLRSPRSAWSVWRRLSVAYVALALPAAWFLLPDRLPLGPPRRFSPVINAAGFSPLVAALVLLSGVIVCLLPLAAVRVAGLAGGPASALARWRIGGWWRRNLAAGLLLVFATAVAGVALTWMAALRTFDPAAGPFDPLLVGMTGSLAAGFGTSALIVLVVAGSVARAGVRAADDIALRFHGLPAGVLRRARVKELRVVLGLSAVCGASLGLLVALTARPS